MQSFPTGHGFFITLEGGEGTGKSTQISLLAGFLREQGYDVVTTREPGGTPEAEKIRELLVHRDGGNWTPAAECLLFFTARHMHVETLIKPALAAGKIVISDRFTDSTRAYQSYGHNVLPPEMIESVKQIAIGDFEPDLTFILDIDVKTGLRRAGKRLDEDGSGRTGSSSSTCLFMSGCVRAIWKSPHSMRGVAVLLMPIDQ